MIELKKNNIVFLKNKKKFLIFFSNFCNISLILKKNIKKIERKYNVVFFCINVDKNKTYSIENNIKFLPTIILDLKKKYIIIGNNNIIDFLIQAFSKR